MDILTQYAPELDGLKRMSALAGARRDYVQGGGGNTSVKFGRFMAIKASGYRLSQVTERDGFAALDMAALRAFFGNPANAALADVESAGTAAVRSAAAHIEGLKPLRPSVEAGFHSLLDKYVLHTHCVWANIALCAEDGRAEIEKALSGSGLSWCAARYVNPGAALTFEISRALEQAEAQTGARPGLIFLQNHGLIATAPECEAATKLHETASALMARHFGLAMADYPTAELIETGENRFEAAGDYVKNRLAGGKYGAKELLDESLYPDQQVFFRGSVAFKRAGEAPDAACNIYPDGAIRFACARATAEAILDTLEAVIFIRETLSARGLAVTPMNAAAQGFIAGWEAEAARKRMMQKS